MTAYNSSFISRFLIFPFILLLLFSGFTSVLSETGDADDLEDIEELIAIDDEQEIGEASDPASHFESTNYGKKSEAEVLTKAQRIVLELNSDNTKRVIEENEYVFVLGYAPWDGKSAELMPGFAEAANSLKNMGNGLLMAKLDGERHPKVASSLGIKGFPTLLLFVNGTSQSYTGGFSSEDIVTWASKKTGSPVITTNSVAEAEELLKHHTVYALGLFDKFEGAEYEEFYKAAAADNEIQFVQTCSIEVAKVLFPEARPEKPLFCLVKSEPEHYTSLDGKLTKDSILHFLENNKFPLVTVMTELNSANVYSSTLVLKNCRLPFNKIVYLFAEADDLKKLLDPLRSIAKKFKSQIMFVAVDIGVDNLAKPFLTLFGLEESEETVVVAFDYKSHSKYLLESDPTPQNIEDFGTGLVQGTLPPYYKSQPIPENKDGSILTVVGKTFDDLVLSSPKNILLEVLTPWCIMCETTSKQIEKLAKHFDGLDSLIFARIDASGNEHPKLQVDDYPALLFYSSSNKLTPIKLSTKLSLKDLASLINKNLKSQDSPANDEL